MLHLPPGFRAFRSDHCVTGSMRHIYDFNNHPMSEDLLLGLGSGVGFIYWHMKNMPPFIGGRANTGRPGEDGLEKTAGRRAGVRVGCNQTSSASKADKAFWKAIAAGPVMIRVDMGFLPYLGLPQGYHFGGHVVVVAAADDRAQQALVSDRDEKLHEVSMKDLAKARGSTFKPFPPRNALFTFDFSGKRSPTPEDVRQAIRETARGMLNPPITNLGVKGIRKAAACVGKWRDTMSDHDFRMACFNAFIFIDATGGTGGGIFRYMYGRFLEEAAAITGESALESLGTRMCRIGDRWQEAASLFKELSGGDSPTARLTEVRDLMKGIAEDEQAAWTELAQYVQ